jgi:protoporphyrin/coproporphyrin ferrochelatase
MPTTPSQKNVSAILLVHFGCPCSLQIRDVYKFLVEIFDKTYTYNFGFFQKIIAQAILAPAALGTALKRYRSIHTREGFPLMIHCRQFVLNLNEQLGNELVFLSMQHGQPSIENMCREISARGFQKIAIIPLYPQKIPGMTQSVNERANRAIQASIRKKFINEFYCDDWYIDPLVQMLQKKHSSYETVLFSYHSVPEKNGFSYKQQCYETSISIMNKLHIPIPWSIGFQSKAGWGKWLAEDTRTIVIDLAQQGVKTLLVVGSGFITPCSETIIDIEQGMQELFLQHGGKHLGLLSPLCSEETFIIGFSKYLADILT